MDVGRIIESAIGGENIATTIEGRERYPINVCAICGNQDDPQKLQRVLVDTPTYAQYCWPNSRRCDSSTAAHDP
ncbi:MAG: hypothetical protein U0231_12470 [Nitrospiraceae bacterium]